MDLNAFLQNKWIEYSGGSRPETNFIRFEKQGSGDVDIKIRYIFDWDTEEVVNLNFRITKLEYDRLVNELQETGFSKFAGEKLLFEWRFNEERIQFRLKGTSISPLSGPITYNLSEYRDFNLEVDDLLVVK